MTNRYVQEGDVMDYTAAADVAVTDVLVIGARIGIPLTAIPSGKTGAVAVEGVFTLPKLSTDNLGAGALVYWDATNKRITATASGNTLAGYAFAPAAAGTTTVNVKIND